MNDYDQFMKSSDYYWVQFRDCCPVKQRKKIVIFPTLISGSVLNGVQKPRWAGSQFADCYQSLHTKAEGSG